MVPSDKRAQLIYLRAGNSSGELTYLVLMRDGQPMRYFPLGTKVPSTFRWRWSITLDEMPADVQVCNCNGVSKAAIAACVSSGKRSSLAVMDATRAGKGCGSCKGLVGDLVAWLCGGEVEEDPSVHYYVPCIPLNKPDLIKAIRDQGLKSVSAVFRALAGGMEDAASKPALSSLLITLWNEEYEDERDARFINDRVHGNIQKDGTFSVIPEMPGGVCTPAELKRIAEVAVNTTSRSSR